MAIRVYPYLSPRVIEVLAPQTEITIQSLTDQIKDWEDEPSNLTYPVLVKTFGKQALGGGIQVGITAELQNAKVSFQARDGTDNPPEVICVISGGNLVALDLAGASMTPIYPTAYTQVVISQSSSATIATPPSDDHLLYLISSLLGRQKSVGSFIYWNPTSGLDTNDGTTATLAVLTFAKAQTLTTAGAGDTIFCVSSHTSGSVTITEKPNITTANLKLHGPGINAKLIPTTTTTPTITIAANNVEVSGFYLETAATGTQNAITVDGDNVLIRDCWIGAARSHGIAVTSSARFRLSTSVLENCGGSGAGDGINLGNSTSQAHVSQCIINANQNGIVLSGTTISDNIIESNLIYKNTAYGIDIASGVLRTMVRGENTITNNTTGNTRDLGTDTYIETPAGGASAGDIADAVWNEVIADHVTAGTTGKTLKDAKTKATLASLK